MPKMNGREVANRVVASRGDVKVIYMSGYDDDTVAQSGVVESGTSLLVKPFTVNGLLDRVRRELDQY